MKIFAFDCYLRAVARIEAEDEEQAQDLLRQILYAASPQEVASVITEASVLTEGDEECIEDPEVFEIVHEDGRVESMEEPSGPSPEQGGQAE